MKIGRIGSFTLSFAALAVMGLAALPARAANINAASLDDGRVHGFSGCLAEEPTGTHFFDLKNAKTDDGKTMGTLRLTSSLLGITKPEESLNREVHSGRRLSRSFSDRSQWRPRGRRGRRRDGRSVLVKVSELQ
jgi:hypothetical protein